ncbi:MAG: hypothetical protein JXP39_05280 [Spirochaetales bacterium]|nr:hypothetical protein [Spirochaetales bacterium]
MMFLFAGASMAVSEPPRAVLIEGTVASEGLPGFLPNRLSALRGRYRVSGDIPVDVYATAEPLVFSPLLWAEVRQGGLQGHESVPRPDDSEDAVVFAFPRRLAMQEALADLRDWHFLCVFPRTADEALRAAFAAAFAEKTAASFQRAKRLSDLSFPAVF